MQLLLETQLGKALSDADGLVLNWDLWLYSILAFK